MIEREKLVVIVGPTAVGKTGISVQVAGKVNGEIISGDSMQVYRGMDIGTAKISPEEMVAPAGQKIPHHLIDIVNPDGNFSVADFQRLARKMIWKINERGKIPLLVGGTGLYINSLIDLYNLGEMDKAGSSWDSSVREIHRAEADAESLYLRLSQIDPDAARRIHPHDMRRVIRALEVFQHTGKTITEVQRSRLWKIFPYHLVMVGLFMEREILYRKINDRVDRMIQEGLIKEVASLLKQGYHPRLTSMQGLGYRQIAAYLTGILTRDEAITLMKRDTRRYAKRQFTWFKRDERIRWFNVSDYAEKSLCVQKITDYIGRTLDIPVE